jgi:hypothetical protein
MTDFLAQSAFGFRSVIAIFDFIVGATTVSTLDLALLCRLLLSLVFLRLLGALADSTC